LPTHYSQYEAPTIWHHWQQVPHLKTQNWLHKRGFMVNFVHFRNTKYTNYHAPWERPIWPPRVKCDCDQASIFARPQGEMRYLVYMRYEWVQTFQPFKHPNLEIPIIYLKKETLRFGSQTLRFSNRKRRNVNNNKY
jgi:hypothetical protein